MNTRWRKIAGDFRAHRLQIALIGVVLTVGAAGVIAALNARAVLQRESARSFAAADVPDLALWFEKVDEPLLAKIRGQPGVAAVDARRVVFTRAAGGNGQTFLMRLMVLRDFAQQQLGRVHRDNALWPNDPSGIFLEQSGRTLVRSAPGDALHVRTPTGETVTAALAGYVHDPAVAPSTQDRALYGYVTPATAESLGQSAVLDQALVKLKTRGTRADRASFAEDLRDALKAEGENPLRAEALSITHPHALLMMTMLRVLQAFAFVALLCSGALVLYMLSLWMKREARQVGIMKTLGARTHQLAEQYIGLVAPLILVANLVAWPVGIWLGRALILYYRESFNIDVQDFHPPRSLLAEELLFTVVLPFVAMALPILRAARMTALRAIQSTGIVAPGRTGSVTVRLLKLPGDRRVTFALRNTFRRPGRLAITLTALSAGAALILTANSTYESLMRVVDLSLGRQGHDIHLQVQQPVSPERLLEVAQRVPDVEIAEAWRTAPVTIALAGEQSPRLSLLAFPGGTCLFKLALSKGALPRPEETDAIILNGVAREELRGVEVGSEVELHCRERRSKARVVAIVEEIGAPAVYANYATFEAITGADEAASVLRVKTSPGAVEAVSAALDQAFLEARMPVSLIQTRDQFRTSLEEHFAVVTDVMRVIAVSAALLGAISLVAAAGLNVIERAREIGIVRALGASSRTVHTLFLIESSAVVVMSTLIGIAVAVFFTRGLNGMAEQQLLHVDVPLHISRSGLALLAAGIGVVMIAVWVFLRRMLRISVRDALAYE